MLEFVEYGCSLAFSKLCLNFVLYFVCVIHIIHRTIF